MNETLLTLEIRCEEDVVLVRQRARQIAALLQFSPQEQTAIATAVSELARNAFKYAQGGRVEFSVPSESRMLMVVVRDRGPGISNIDDILDGRYVSQTGMGLGIIGSKRLSDRFTIQSTPGETVVTIGKRLPRHSKPISPQLIASVTAELARSVPRLPMVELEQQNRELLMAMEEARLRQAEVERLNAELAETNRGVLALYAELDEKAASLHRASESKSRFLSNVSHELRTPLNAMFSISGLLLDRADGELTTEQEKQVRFIRRSAESLREMVNDLLDLARIESGRVELHISDFNVNDVFAALRGVFRPLLVPGGPPLLIQDPATPIHLHSDERKLTQILRNFVSNALKFTEQGEVRLEAVDQRNGLVRFDVTDTGIGIPPEHIDDIFEEFVMLDSPVQRRVKGTGLGLPLARQLALLLGGEVSVTSTLGSGSTFSVVVPVTCPEPSEESPVESEAMQDGR
jgi:signal transduction histidine kinase